MFHPHLYSHTRGSPVPFTKDRVRGSRGGGGMVELCHLHPFHLEDIVPVELKPFMLHIVQTVESNLCLFLENSIYKILTNK